MRNAAHHAPGAYLASLREAMEIAVDIDGEYDTEDTQEFSKREATIREATKLLDKKIGLNSEGGASNKRRFRN